MHDLLIAAFANWARKQTRGTGCRIRHCVYGSILGVQSRPTVRLCSRYVQYRPRAQRHRGTETRGRIRNVGEALTGPASTSQARGEFKPSAEICPITVSTPHGHERNGVDRSLLTTWLLGPRPWETASFAAVVGLNHQTPYRSHC
jgi:hypothetical protein